MVDKIKRSYLPSSLQWIRNQKRLASKVLRAYNQLEQIAKKKSATVEFPPRIPKVR